MTSSISIRGLSKTYRGGVRALRDLTLEVPAGSVFGFLGPNGAGKTTTLRVLAGLSHPDAGNVTVAGVPLGRGADYRRHVGYLGQEPRFYGWMTGRQTLRYVTGFYPCVSEPIEARIDEVLALVGLDAAAGRKTATYSGGMLQRLGIAQALVARPAVLLLDEPASSLDPGGRREVLELMHSLRGTTTIFYSTHILDDVERVADRVAIIDRGRLVVAAPTAELLSGARQSVLQVEVTDPPPGFDGRLRALPDVTVVECDRQAAHGGPTAFLVRVADGSSDAVQRAITGLVAREGLALNLNRPRALDLETAFLRLVGGGEAAR